MVFISGNFDNPIISNSCSLQVNLSTYAFLFSEIVQYSHGRVTSLSQLHEKLVPFSSYSCINICVIYKTTYIYVQTIINWINGGISSWCTISFPLRHYRVWTTAYVFKRLKYSISVLHNLILVIKPSIDVSIWHNGICPVLLVQLANWCIVYGHLPSFQLWPETGEHYSLVHKPFSVLVLSSHNNCLRNMLCLETCLVTVQPVC